MISEKSGYCRKLTIELGYVMLSRQELYYSQTVSAMNAHLEMPCFDLAIGL